MDYTPGPVLLFGSGEIAPGAQRAYRALFTPMARPVRLSILETPAGFELNSHWVACRVANYLEEHLQTFVPEVSVVPARKRGTELSPDDPDIVAPLLQSSVVYLGAGSPTYAVRQLQDTLAWHLLKARHCLGVRVIFASASVLAAGAYTIPVYEIFKVGEDVHWKDGLDLFGTYSLSLAFVPHWNNTEGGANLDTSRCFMGRPRFRQLLEMLPTGVTVVGIDERTQLLIDLQEQRCHVLGQGGVTLMRNGAERFYESELCFAVAELGPFEMPQHPCVGIPADVWACLEAARRVGPAGGDMGKPDPPAEVLALMGGRSAARARRDWATADALRDQVRELGWEIRDTPSGSEAEPLER